MSRSLRVLMTADSVGGVLSYATDLCRGLAKMDVEVLLAIMGGPLRPSQRAELDAIGVSIAESSHALEWMDDPWHDVDAAGRWLLELAELFRPHVVHSNGYAHGSLPWPCPVLVVAHSCVTSWFEAVHGTPLPYRYTQYLKRVQVGLRAASAVVAPSAWMADAIERHYGPLPHSVRVIANGIWLEDYASEEPSSPFVLAAGRVWDEAKNLALLAEIAPSLPWPVKIAGEPEGRALPAGAEALGMLDRSALAREMARAAIFVHPARYEPFGLAPLEAAASGCALVVSDIPSLRSIWRGSAELVPARDGAALRRALQELCASASHRTSVAQRAQIRARTYDAESMTSAYAVLYGSLCARSARARKAN